MNEREKLYLLVELLDGCSDGTREQLLRRYRDAEELISCARSESALGGLSSEQAEKLLREALSRLEAHGVTLLTREDERYPRALFRLKASPRSLFALGNIGLLHSDCLAVVGTRECSPNDYTRVRALAREVARAGYTVVSGMALGCDAAAHRGALDVGGNTIAVLAGSVRDIYPKENAVLYREILDSGLILSELPEGARVYPASFLRRNRIVAGLSRAVLVTYARERSGTWSTARHAVKCGSRLLLLRGAAEAIPEFADGIGTAVEDVREVLDALKLGSDASAQTGMFDPVDPQSFGDRSDREPRAAESFSVAEARSPSESSPSLSETVSECDPSAREGNAPGASGDRNACAEACCEKDGNGAVLALLKRGERSFAELVEATGMPTKQIQTCLLLLELGGKAERLPGNRYRAR